MVATRVLFAMMMPRMTVCMVPRTQPNVSGMKKVKMLMAIMNREALEASRRLRRYNNCIVVVV